jgi:hypothetical protein
MTRNKFKSEFFECHKNLEDSFRATKNFEVPSVPQKFSLMFLCHSVHFTIHVLSSVCGKDDFAPHTMRPHMSFSSQSTCHFHLNPLPHLLPWVFSRYVGCTRVCLISVITFDFPTGTNIAALDYCEANISAGCSSRAQPPVTFLDLGMGPICEAKGSADRRRKKIKWRLTSGSHGEGQNRLFHTHLTAHAWQNGRNCTGGISEKFCGTEGTPNFFVVLKEVF